MEPVGSNAGGAVELVFEGGVAGQRGMNAHGGEGGRCSKGRRLEVGVPRGRSAAHGKSGPGGAQQQR